MMDLELVRWRDAHSELDEPEVQPADFLCETVGWVREQGPLQADGHGLWVVVVGEHTPNGNRAITYIPAACVEGRYRLAYAEAR